MAMSYVFEGNCAKTIEYEERVSAFWKTREVEEPNLHASTSTLVCTARLSISAGQ